MEDLRDWRRASARLVPALVMGAAIVVSTFLSAGLARTQAAAPAAVAPPAAPALSAGSYGDLVARVAPSVVTVRADRVTKAAPAELPFILPFGPQLGTPPEGRQRQHGLGSGVIVGSDGLILTNHHVVEGAEKIRVELQDRRTLPATLVGSDAASDLAVLRVDQKGLPALPLGDSSAVRVGDVVLAFGNPLGVGQTVTMGIVSAKGRATGLGEGSFEDFLQTDAAINQGNSGGALVNTAGQLVGINSQILSPSGGNIGIGFAIPTSMARSVMTQIVEHGSVRRGQLGVIVQGVTSDLARSLGLSEVKGALVSTVSEGSPAEKAGLERGDVITALNGEPIEDGNVLRNRVAATAPGATVTLQVQRGGQTKTIVATLRELPPTRSASAEVEDQGEGGRLGLAVKPLTPEEAKEAGVAGRRGLVVVNVDPAGPAAEAGFRPGDVIEEVDGKPIADVAALRAAVKASGERPALVLVAREGGTLFLTLQRQA